jgi:hypothetical protein
MALLVVAGCSHRALPESNTGAGSGGDASADALSPDPAADLAAVMTFHARVALTAKIMPTLGSIPDHLDVTVVMDTRTPSMVFGGTGTGVRVSLRRLGDSYTATIPFGLSLNPARRPLCDGLRSIRYTHLELTARPNGVDGTGEAVVEGVAGGDVVWLVPVTLAVSGVPDRTGPDFGPELRDLDPLPEVTFLAPEPLPLGTSAALIGSDGARIELSPMTTIPVRPDDAFTIGFRLQEQPLRYGAGYQMELVPGSDLAGRPLARTLAVHTADLPPLLPEDGFESAGDMVGGAQVVDATTLPPIAGARSVLLPPSAWAGLPVATRGRITVRLAVEPGDTRVRLSVQPVSMSERFFSGNGEFFRVASGGAITRLAREAREEPVTVSGRTTPGGLGVWLGRAATVEIPLPPGTKDEVVFDASNENAFCSWPMSDGYLLDDLRVE